MMKKTLEIIKNLMLFVVIGINIYLILQDKTKQDSLGDVITVDTTDYQKPKLDSICKQRDSIIYKINYIDNVTYGKINDAINASDSAVVQQFIYLVSKD